MKKNKIVGLVGSLLLVGSPIVSTTTVLAETIQLEQQNNQEKNPDSDKVEEIQSTNEEPQSNVIDNDDIANVQTSEVSEDPIEPVIETNEELIEEVIPSIENETKIEMNTEKELKEDTIEIISENVATEISKQLKIEVTHNFNSEQLAKIKKITLKLSDEDAADIAKLTNLTYLNANAGSLTDISFVSNLKNLTILYVGNGNKITDISAVKELTNLVELSFKNNYELKDISPLVNLVGLKKLWLNDNKIEDVSSLANLTNLIYLELERNQISDLSPITDSIKNVGENFWAYDQTITLTEEQPIIDGKVVVPVLDFESILPIFNSFSFTSEAGTYDEKSKIMSWNDDGKVANSYKFISENEKFTGKVNFTIEGASEKVAFTSEKVSTEVSKQLGVDPRSEFTKAELSTINKITLKLSDEDTADISKLTNLTYLNANDGSLTDISFVSNLKNLTILYVGNGNKITDITAVKELTNLVELSFRNNYELKDISPLENLTGLKKLWLNDNKIADVSSLANLTNLTFLELQKNQISELSSIADIIKNVGEQFQATDQTITLPGEHPIVDGKTVVPVLDFKSVLPLFNSFSFTSEAGTYDENAGTMSWDYDGGGGDSYTFSSEAGNFTGEVNVFSEGASETVNIASDRVAQHISDSLGIDKTNTFTKGQLSIIKGLTIEDSQLTQSDLKDVAKLTKLKQLSLLGKGQSDIADFSELAPLTRLTSFNISDMPNLKDISPVKHFKKLTHLYAMRNSLESIAGISMLTDLKQIHFQDNRIKDISPLKDLINLETINFGVNKIEDLAPLKGLTKLTSAELYINKIIDVSSLSNLTNFTNLSLYLNNIRDVKGLKNLTNLVTLKLSENAIEDVSPLDRLDKLNTLYVGSNHICDLSLIPNVDQITNFDAKNQLVILDEELPMIDNKIVASVANFDKNLPVFKNFIFTADNGYFDAEKRLMNIDYKGEGVASYNFISENELFSGEVIMPIKGISSEKVEITSDIVALEISEQLDVDVTHVFTRFQLAQIKTLYVDSPELNQGALEDVSKLTNIQNLTFRGGVISDLNILSPLKKLTFLNLGGMKSVKDISVVTNFKKLIEFYANQDSISDISPLKSLNNLEKIQVNENLISDVSALADTMLRKDFNKLTEFSVNGNQIADITPIEGIVTSAKDQMITTDGVKTKQNKASVKNIMPKTGLSERIGDLTMSTDDLGKYNEDENSFSWDFNLLNKFPDTVNYNFISSTGIYSGTVNVPVEYEQGGKVTVKYQDENGEELAKTEELTGFVGENFQTKEQKIKNAELLRVEGNENGTFSYSEQTVTYIYKKLNANEPPGTENPKADHENNNQGSLSGKDSDPTDSDSDDNFPQTGEKLLFWIVGLGVTLISVAGYIFYKKRK